MVNVYSKVKKASLRGRKLFHVKNIKLSYRIRGIVARTQMNKVAINIVLVIKESLVIIGI